MSTLGTIFEIVNFTILGTFLLSEILINAIKRGERTKPNPHRGRINNSLIMAVGLSSILLATTIGFLAKFMDIRWLFSPNYFISSLGLLLIITGEVIRVSAVLTLNKYFTVDVTILDDHKLVRSGMFKTIRHPSYCGLLIAVLGLGITMVNWLSTLILLIPHIVMIILRIQEEEKTLAEHFGEEYEQYQRNSKRLIPFVY